MAKCIAFSVLFIGFANFTLQTVVIFGTKGKIVQRSKIDAKCDFFMAFCDKRIFLGDDKMQSVKICSVKVCKNSAA